MAGIARVVVVVAAGQMRARWNGANPRRARPDRTRARAGHGAPALRGLCQCDVRARRGHLFQGRFGSVAMDEDHLMAAARTVALNPAPARRVGRAWDWPHSSVKRASGRPRRRARLACSRSSTARRASPIFSTRDADDPAFAALRRSELIGRPLGDDAFLDAISRRLNRVVTPRKRGRKPKGDVAGAEAKG